MSQTLLHIMSFFGRLVLLALTNAAALYAAERFIAGFSIADLETLLIASGVLTLINLTVRPLLKIILFPVIVLTLGIGNALVTIATLILLDRLVPGLAIDGVVALAGSALVIGLINLICQRLLLSTPSSH